MKANCLISPLMASLPPVSKGRGAGLVHPQCAGSDAYAIAHIGVCDGARGQSTLDQRPTQAIVRFGLRSRDSPHAPPAARPQV
jgi:hypothetical protein